MARDTDTTELSLASLELDQLQACVELMFLAAYADGVVDASERAKFEEHVVAATRGQLGPSLVQTVLTHIEGTVQRANRGKRLQEIGARLGGNMAKRRAALVLAMEVATADAVLTDEERDFLREAAAVLGIEENDALRILDGMV